MCRKERLSQQLKEANCTIGRVQTSLTVQQAGLAGLLNQVATLDARQASELLHLGEEEAKPA
jgi:hypothetical protein